MGERQAPQKDCRRYATAVGSAAGALRARCMRRLRETAAVADGARIRTVAGSVRNQRISLPISG